MRRRPPPPARNDPVRVQCASTGTVLALHESGLLGAGGEARIYAVTDGDSLVAKLWHKPSPERARKVRVMVANPPLDPMAAQRHASIAWPIDWLHTPGRPQEPIGFLMPRVSGMRPLAEFCTPKPRREQCPLFSYLYLYRTARNLATAVRALHERGYVIGDLNESNVLVSETSLVTVVDTDSFQVWDAEAGLMYRCRVGKPEFTPPELQGRNFAQVDREPAHDRFGLGVLIFQLLMEGTHPFAGICLTQGDPPPLEERIAKGLFPYATDVAAVCRPKPTAPPFEILTPGLRDLFLRCFQDGRFRPALRPEPQSWQWLLEEAESHLVSCWVNNQHLYADHLEHCPWCERARFLGGRDPFPSVEAVRKGIHLAPARRRPSGGPHRPTPASSAPSRRPLPPGPLPTPPPIPTSSTSRVGRRRRPRPLLGDWNDWAWIGLTLSTLGAGAVFGFSGRSNPVTFLFGLLGLLASVLGEGKAHLPELDGRGRWIARTGLALGLGAVVWCLIP